MKGDRAGRPEPGFQIADGLIKAAADTFDEVDRDLRERFPELYAQIAAESEGVRIEIEARRRTDEARQGESSGKSGN